MTLDGFMKNFSHDADLYDNASLQDQCFSEALDHFADAICGKQRENFFQHTIKLIATDEGRKIAERLCYGSEIQPRISDLI
jgi:hypothetical protein